MLFVICRRRCLLFVVCWLLFVSFLFVVVHFFFVCCCSLFVQGEIIVAIAIACASVFMFPRFLFFDIYFQFACMLIFDLNFFYVLFCTFVRSICSINFIIFWFCFVYFFSVLLVVKILKLFYFYLILLQFNALWKTSSMISRILFTIFVYFIVVNYVC